jgi:hypothetical protein
MYDPTGPDSPNEFVELFNTSSTDTVDLSGWQITDNMSTDDLDDAGDGLRIPPLRYIVILEGDYDILNGIYKNVIPTNAIKLKVGTTTIGNNLGNTVDSLFLQNNFGITMDSMGWVDITSAGYSIEKVRLELPNTSGNWKESKKYLGTPGATNSVTPKNIDGAIQGNITFNPNFPNSGEVIIAQVPVYNAGIQNITGKIIGSINSPSLNFGQTSVVGVSLSTFPSGSYNIVFNFSVTNDEYLENNIAIKRLNVSYTPGILKINEFHSNPGENQIEFIELVSAKSFVMDGWRIADKSSSNLLPITYIEKDDYIVIASDSSLKPLTKPDAKYLIPYGGLPTLNNTGDTIYLIDMNHTIIDSLSYGAGWPVVADTSTEKLRPDLISNDPVNWKNATNVFGMTPGYVNSNYLVDFDGEIISDSIHHEPEFPKSNQSIQLNIPITNQGALSISGNLSIFENENLIGTSGFVDIAHRDTSILQISLPIMDPGIHPLKIELEVAEDQNLENNIAADTIYVSYEFGSILINEFLPRPVSPQAEFVELVSFDNVDLTNWSIADKTNTLCYFNGGTVTADNYVVLSEDPAFATIIPQETLFIEVEDFPSLNNYGDTIYLRDFAGTIIDSLEYTTWWDLATGKSTEKIHPEFISNDSIGWKISIDSTGMTPGSPNSVMAKNIDGTIVSDGIIVSPEFPKTTEPIHVTIPVVNIGLQTIAGNLIIEENGNAVTNSIITELGLSDTILINIQIPPMSSGPHEITISLDIGGDEDLSNNVALIDILISYNFGDVMINEFLPDPEYPLSEFVEIIAQETVDFTGWSISDNRKELEEFNAGNVEAKTYIVLSEDTSLTALLPSDALFVNVDNFPSLNNSGDGIFLYDFNGKIIDSLNYNNTEWSLKSGVSTEKLFPDYISDDASNWKISTDSSSTTIGRTNSVLLRNINGVILPNLTSHYPEYPHPSESIVFEIAVVNNGIVDISGNVSVLHNDNEIGSSSFNNLISEDTTIVLFNIEPLPSGKNQIEIVLDVPDDMNLHDNSIVYSVFVSYPFGSVVFNEFLARPDTTQTEFVEIISLNDINLTEWSISDNTLRQYYFSEVFASANQPVVITSDSLFIASLPQGTLSIIPIGGWPTLNNTSDGLFLYDPTGTIIDSLNYDKDWPITDDRSTEKFRPEFESYNMNRWGIAVNTEAMTPGIENSLHFDELPEAGVIAFEANPFSPNGDGIDDELLIKYKLPYEQGIIKLQIFDMTGRNIATPYWNVHFPQEGLLKWDGKRDDGNNARIGIYIVKLLAKNPATGKTWEKVKTVVLAKQL